MQSKGKFFKINRRKSWRTIYCRFYVRGLTIDYGFIEFMKEKQYGQAQHFCWFWITLWFSMQSCKVVTQNWIIRFHQTGLWFCNYMIYEFRNHFVIGIVCVCANSAYFIQCVSLLRRRLSLSPFPSPTSALKLSLFLLTAVHTLILSDFFFNVGV